MPKFDATEYGYLRGHYNDRRIVAGVTDINGKRWLLQNGYLVRGEEKYRLTKKALQETVGF